MSGSGSGYNRVEDVYMLKTRNLVLQNQNGTFPTKNYVFAMGDSNGHVTPTTNVSVTTVVASTSVTTAKVVASTSVTTAKVVATDVIASTILVTDISAETIHVTDISAETIHVTDISAETILVTDISAETILVTDISAETILVTDVSASTILVTDISAGTIHVTDISAGTILVTDISAETIHVTDISAGTIHVTDISAGTIHVTDISAGTIEVVGTMIISDLSLNFLNVTDISAGTIEVGTRLTATDISAGNIYVNDISATDISASLIEVCSATSHVVIQPNNIFIENFVVNEDCFMSTFSSNFGDSGLYMSQSTNTVQARIGLANIDGDFHIARGGNAPFTNIDPVIIGQSKTTLNNPVVCNGKLTVTDISAETINVTDISASSYINIGLNSSASYVPGNLYVSNDVSGSECFLQTYSTGFGDSGIYMSQSLNSNQARIGLSGLDSELHIARGLNALFDISDSVIIGTSKTTLNNPVVCNNTLTATKIIANQPVVAIDSSDNKIAIGNAVFTTVLGNFPVTFNNDVASIVCSTYLEVSHDGAFFYIPMLSTKPV